MESERWRDCLLIALIWVAFPLVLYPFQNTPFVDDWVYAWPAEQLFLHRPLRVLDYSGSINLVQALWGALFCLPGGFSFSALRVSTWTTALICLWCFYLLLREIRISRRDSLIGVATLALNPVFFILSFTFMTDVPFLACMMGSMLAFTRALSTRRNSVLWLAALLAGLSMTIRVTGALLSVAMVLVLLFHAQSWERRRGRFLIPLVAFGVFAVIYVWYHHHIQFIADLALVKNSPPNRLASIMHYAVPMLPPMLLRDITFTASALGLALLPLAMAWIDRRRLIAATGIFAALWLCAWVIHLKHIPDSPQLSHASTVAIDELGATQALVPNDHEIVQPPWLVWGITSIALASGAVIFSSMVSRPRDSHTLFLRWLALGAFLLTAVMWLFYDRYALTMIPIAIALLLGTPARATPGPIDGPALPGKSALRRPRWAMAMLILLGAYSLAAVRDHLHYNGAVWQGVDDLRESGVPISQIDGGYVVNGWLQYAHPENAPRNLEGEVRVPGINDYRLLPYQISNSPLPGWTVLKSVPYNRWVGHSGRIYELEKNYDTEE